MQIKRESFSPSFLFSEQYLAAILHLLERRGDREEMETQIFNKNVRCSNHVYNNLLNICVLNKVRIVIEFFGRCVMH